VSNASQIVPFKLESKILFDVINKEVCSIFLKKIEIIYHFFAPNLENKNLYWDFSLEMFLMWRVLNREILA